AYLIIKALLAITAGTMREKAPLPKALLFTLLGLLSLNAILFLAGEIAFGHKAKRAGSGVKVGLVFDVGGLGGKAVNDLADAGTLRQKAPLPKALLCTLLGLLSLNAILFLAGESAFGHKAKRAGSGVKVGLVFDVGGLGDKSFNDLAYAGLIRGVEELGIES